MTDMTIRPVGEDEFPAFVRGIMEGFGADIPGAGFVERFRETLPLERTLAAFEGDHIVGTFGGFDLELSVPGGSVPMEGTTCVTVYPTHRRMGLLSRMMRVHIDTAVKRGTPIAGLWSSESGIYGRFGYGIAAYNQGVEIRGPEVIFRKGVEVDRVRRVDAEEGARLFPAIFAHVAARTPGMFARPEAWWKNRVFHDSEWQRKGKTTLRYVLHEGADGAEGYACYRLASTGEGFHPDGTVHVVEVMAATERAHASLWSFLTNVDGCPIVRSWNLPLSDPLAWKLREPRAIRREASHDSLWIRILDVAGALEARTYEQDGSITFRVVDSYLPDVAGTYALTIDGGRGRCVRSEAIASVELDVDVLGAILLGEPSLSAYAAAGRARGEEAEVRRLGRLFMTSQRPWCNQIF